MSDILVHIGQSLDPQAQAELEETLQRARGVRRATLSRKARHLMIVDYEADQISSSNILHTVKNNGYQAVLVGL